MLQKLNERIQGVIAWLVVIIIGVTFTLFGLDYYLQSHQSNNFKAVVNGHGLGNQLFEVNYRRARSMQDLTHMTAEDDKQLQNQTLDQMITNDVMIQSAHFNGFTISEDQANAAIVKIPQFQEDGHFSSEKYQQALSAALFTQSSFQTEVRQGMLLNQQRFGFMGSSFALPEEINRYVALYLQSRDYDYLTINRQTFEKKAQVSSDMINSYYNDHRNEFLAPEQVSIDYVTLSMNNIKNAISISNDEVEKFYDENKNNYLTPAQWHVAHILFALPKDASHDELLAAQSKAENTYKLLLKKPENFNQLVTTLSDDKLSIPEQGALPWISAGQNEYAKSLSHLTTVGQISAPEKTAYGYEIFKLLDYKPVQVQTLIDVEHTIKEQLSTELAQSKYAQMLEQLSDISYQSPDTLEPVARALNLKIISSPLFSRNDAVDAVTKNPHVIQAAFSHDVLQLGNNSEPLQLDNDTVTVIRVNKHTPEKQLTLDQTREKITALLITKNSEKEAMELGEKIINTSNESVIESLLQSQKMQWTSLQHVTRESDKIAPLINDLAFNLEQANSISGVSMPNGDYVVVKLKAVNDGSLETLDKEQKDSLVQQIEANYGTMDYDLYEKSLVNNAVIEKMSK